MMKTEKRSTLEDLDELVTVALEKNKKEEPECEKTGDIAVNWNQGDGSHDGIIIPFAAYFEIESEDEKKDVKKIPLTVKRKEIVSKILESNGKNQDDYYFNEKGSSVQYIFVKVIETVINVEIGECDDLEKGSIEEKPSVEIEVTEEEYSFRDPIDLELIWREDYYRGQRLFKGTIIPLPKDVRGHYTNYSYYHRNATREYMDEEKLADIVKTIEMMNFNPNDYLIRSDYSSSCHVYIEGKKDITNEILGDVMEKEFERIKEKMKKKEEENEDDT